MGPEHSGPDDQTTRRLDDLWVDRTSALRESCLKTMPASGDASDDEVDAKSSSSSSSGSRHHVSGASRRSPAGTTANQKQSMLLARARCSGRWNEKASPANGKWGTLSQSPMTGPWLEAPP